MSILLDEIIFLLTHPPWVFSGFLGKILFYSFAVIIFITGIQYGNKEKGTADYREIFENGLAIGLSIGFIEGFLSYFMGFFFYNFLGGFTDSCILMGLFNPIFEKLGFVGFILGLGASWIMVGVASSIRFTVPTIVLTLIFIAGVRIGDSIEKNVR